MSTEVVVRTLGELRRALEAFADDCPILTPTEVIYTFDPKRGGYVELFVNSNLE